jgi:RND family efflux transporter MFP subunit
MVLPGYTAAWHTSTIYARVDGYVGNWSADIGDHVHAGQVLAVIETPDLDAELAAAHAQLQADEATVQVRKAESQFSRTTYERWRDSPQGVVSEQEREEKKAGYDSALARQKSAEADVALARAQADKYEALSQFKKVTAPYDGVITVRDIDIGNLVTAGSTANTTLLYRVSQNDPMRVFVDVPQRVAPEMRPGVEARITASNLVGQVFVGKIARTADAIDRRARTLRVEVDIPNSKQVLVPGMYVDVGFDVPTGGLPQVPAAALVFRSSGPQIAQVDRDQRVRFHPVTIARDNGSSVEIGSGLQAGEMIALNISSQIVEGDKVQVSESKASAADGPALGK